MRSRALALTAGLTLAAPTILAFRKGGYFDLNSHPVAPLLTASVAWILVLVVALAAPVPLPRSASGRVALAGLTLLAVWTGASIVWAPVSADATTELQRVLLYLAACVVAAGALRSVRARWCVEPVLVGGVTVVMIYALATRLLPGIITSTPSLLTAGRLEQPLTYYNAQGALAGIGLVLCVHLIGDRVRASRLRAVAAAAVIPMSAAVWLSYSRGALAATAAGLLALLVLAPTWSQVRALALGLVAGTGAVIASLPFPTVSTIKVTGAAERSGAIYLGLLLALAAGAAALTLWAVRREQRAGTRVGRLPLSRAFTLGATASLIVGSALILYVLSTEKTASVKHGHVTTAARLASIDSNRSYYWPVAIRALERHPLNGLGAGGYHTAWLRERPIRDPARWAHSLELQTAADLGLVGLGALGLLLFGCGFAARRAHRHRPDLAAGWCAAGVVWLLHSALDWDWEVPTVTLVALILAGALIGLADERTGPHSQTRDMGRPEHARNDGPAPALTEAASGHAGAQAPLTRAGRAA